jgi:hypothetical protein
MAWGVAVVALLLALLAYGATRRLSRRIEQLTRSYWELRYEYGRLRSQLARLDPEQPADTASDARAAKAGEAPLAFVPMSSLKRQ